ncbi:GntR family transcriptional regulator [Jeotgalibacillus sp. S-D1]|uniref:GntR family transcriptional regulator n=1 Tax=Jeotgalibacillus sp. S-D1 TaxID=2552189 RepID=UPI00105A3A65|nr:GntR family transcriptional regulator [Jeotgalibacillus sp. S-D1]TDL34653.1 GntR family transcriptional regulator [Jeotgalibacillus sp. S-D1]
MSPLIEKKKSIHEQVHQLIKYRIIEGIYPPNERLFEAKIARELQVSRSPVREAIRTLENEGLLIQDKQSRIFVYQPSSSDVEQIYQCRQVMESLAVSLAAKNATDKELDHILELVQTAEQVLSDDKEEIKQELVNLNSLFHDAIIESSKNLRLQKQLNDLRTLTFFYRSMNMEDPKRREEIVIEHGEIAKALINRKHEEASSFMHAHIYTDMVYLINYLDRQNQQ